MFVVPGQDTTFYGIYDQGVDQTLCAALVFVNASGIM